MNPEPTLYLTILEGRSPAEAVPILSTHDPELIHAVAEALVQRLGRRAPGRILSLATRDETRPAERRDTTRTGRAVRGREGREPGCDR